ncbi:MAG: stage IV sporulation protein A [Oscillospiraceae bacterium]|nr:stage IV sporulation protein A [Oscillospiraceae bacterium]
MNRDIYSDIAKRTDGDIYIGVVGPVRTGKSTFIKKFMETLVIPNISGDFKRERAVDELPQSAAGKTIMTTEPKFIPEEAAQISLGESARLNVRLIDCVGYITPSSIGYIENNAPRMVRTPWFDDEIPFNMAAEIGTRKVISEHSTVGLLITSDASITDIPREEYAECEKRIVSELKDINKPFAILLNCVEPDSAHSQELARNMREEYEVPVIPISCIDLDEGDIREILTELLFSFPVKEINIKMPSWISSLEKEHWLRSSVFETIRECAGDVEYVRQIKNCVDKFIECPQIIASRISDIDLGTGSVTADVSLDPTLFYKVLSEKTGIEISNESDLIPILADFNRIKKEYGKVKGALEEAQTTGYGIVMPDMEELSLEEPEIIKQGGKYGVKLCASAPSLHIMRANINTAVCPTVGSERQSEELIMYLLKEFEENPTEIWKSNIFGKTLHELVNEGLHTKLCKMPFDARCKLQETLERIINEGCGGLICFIL